MGTPAAIGFLDASGGWSGTYVGYDGYPAGVGVALLNLAADLDHDLNALRDFVLRPSDGWRYAFSEAYEKGDNAEWFDTKRPDGPPLRHDDPFVRRNLAYWFLFDIEAGELQMHEVPDDSSLDWPVVQRIRFIGASGTSATPPADGPLDWRNRRQGWGSDAPEATASAICKVLSEQLPADGKHVHIQFGGFEGAEPSLAETGLLLPVTMYLDANWKERPDLSAPLFGEGGRLTDIVEHHIRVPRRHLKDQERCCLLFDAAARQLRELAAAGHAPTWATTYKVAELFPLDLLDLQLDASTLRASVTARVCGAMDLGDES